MFEEGIRREARQGRGCELDDMNLRRERMGKPGVMGKETSSNRKGKKKMGGKFLKLCVGGVGRKKWEE